MTPQKNPHSILLFAALAWSGVAAFAQTAPAEPAEAGQSDEALMLTPFVVSTEKDSGYLSTNAATATRIAMKVQDLPFSVSILNQEMLRDLNVPNLDTAFRFINGNDNNGNPPERNFSRMRGFQQIAGSHLRNGFRFGAQKDMFNVERVEVVRGPNSTVVGEADPGGQINIVTKQGVLGQNFGEVSLQAGSYNSLRGSIDYNVSAVVAKLPMALRVNAIYYDTDSFIKFAHEETTGLALNWVVRPTRKTQVSLDFEATDTTRVQETSPGDRWGGAPGYFGGFHYDLRDESYRTIPMTPTVIYGIGEFTTGAFLSPHSYEYAASQAVSGPDSKNETAARFYNLTVDQEITSNWFVQFAGGYSLGKAYYVNRSSALGTYSIGYTGYTQDATGLHYTPGGRYFANLSWTRNDAPQYTPTTDLRLSTVYKLDLSWMKQDITAGVGYYRVGSNEGSYTSTLQTAAGATLRLPVYLDALTEAETGIQRWLNTPGSKWTAGNPGKAAEVKNKGYFISTSGSYLQGRVRTLVGVRKDVTNRKSYSGVWADAARTQGVYTLGESVDTDAVSPLYSISWAPSDKVTLFYTHGSSYKPSTATRRVLKMPIDPANPYGKTLDPESGTGDEIGIKLDLLDHKLALTASAYEINKKNASEFWDQAKIQAWFNDPTEQRRFYTEGVEARSRGFEMEAVWSPSRQLSFTAGYAYLDAITTASPNVPTNVGLPALAYKHSGQLLTKYMVNDGMLKGLIAGSSVVFRGNLLVSNGGKEYAPFPSYVVVNPFVGYQRRLSEKMIMNVTLNITNAFGLEYMKNYARFGEPRSFSLSTSLRF